MIEHIEMSDCKAQGAFMAFAVISLVPLSISRRWLTNLPRAAQRRHRTATLGRLGGSPDTGADFPCSPAGRLGPGCAAAHQAGMTGSLESTGGLQWKTQNKRSPEANVVHPFGPIP